MRFGKEKEKKGKDKIFRFCGRWWKMENAAISMTLFLFLLV